MPKVNVNYLFYLTVVCGGIKETGVRQISVDITVLKENVLGHLRTLLAASKSH